MLTQIQPLVDTVHVNHGEESLRHEEVRALEIGHGLPRVVDQLLAHVAAVIKCCGEDQMATRVFVPMPLMYAKLLRFKLQREALLCIRRGRGTPHVKPCPLDGQ